MRPHANPSAGVVRPSSRASSDALQQPRKRLEGSIEAGHAPAGWNATTQSQEHEPLLLRTSSDGSKSIRHSYNDYDEAQEVEDGPRAEDFEKSRSTLYLVLLSCCMGGLQLAWSVELGSISPFLLELGLSKSLLALVWIAGPLTGTLVQPYIGIRSDECRLKLGRRRPFILGGALATALSLLALAWTKNIVGSVLGIFGVLPKSHMSEISNRIWAISFVYILDIGINVLQAGNRAFIVDSAPTHQQESASAIANIVTGIGGIVGYLCGQAELTTHFSWLGDTQFKILCAIACLILAVSVSISCISIAERDPQSFANPAGHGGSGVVAIFRTLLYSVKSLPPQIKRVCLVQIFNWIGWFPFLFYTTTYVGALYAEPYLLEDPDMSDEAINEVFEEGVRRGSFAMFIFSITTLAASITLPLIISPTYRAVEQSRSTTPMTPMGPGSQSQPIHGDDSDYFSRKTRTTRFGPGLKSFLTPKFSIRVPWLTIRRAWILSHIAFAFLIWLTLLTRSPWATTCIIAAMGAPWALTNWAPFALIAAEISKRDAIRRESRQAHSTNTREGQLLGGEDKEDSADQAGVVLGIHNVAVSAPQVFATLLSSLVFRALQKPRGATGDDSVGWVLRLGGMCAIGAAWFARHVREGDDERHDPNGLGLDPGRL